MKPIYFPFTYISTPALETMASCFKQTIAYQAKSGDIPLSMQEWVEKGVLDLQVPVSTDEEKLNAVIRDYKYWAEIHKENGMAFFKSQKDTIPFFDDSSARQITSDIKSALGVTRAKKEKEKPDPLLNARLFLHIAQEFDMQNWDINQELGTFEQMEQNFFKNLRWETDDLDFTKHKPGMIKDDSGNYMTSERIEAWCHLMQHTSDVSGIFVTDSQAVADYLTENSPDMETLAQINNIPVYENNKPDTLLSWQDELAAYLDMLVKTDWKDIDIDFPSLPTGLDKPRKHMTLQIYGVLGYAPNEFFSRYVSQKFSLSQEYDAENKGVNIKNTLICLAVS